jgi:hypothetical protein
MPTAPNLRHGKLVEVPGNHITFAFGDRAPVAADAILAFVCVADSDRVAP